MLLIMRYCSNAQMHYKQCSKLFMSWLFSNNDIIVFDVLWMHYNMLWIYPWIIIPVHMVFIERAAKFGNLEYVYEPFIFTYVKCCFCVDRRSKQQNIRICMARVYTVQIVAWNMNRGELLLNNKLLHMG